MDNWVNPSSGITRRSIALNNTLYSYWAMCYSTDFRTKMDNVIDGGVPTIGTNNAGALWSRRSWPKYLKYCPLCASEDNAAYGETYWHRQHQLSEMFYCVKHQTRLVNSGVNMRNTATGFYPASSEVDSRLADITFDDLASHKDKLLRIGNESEWLIRHGLEVDWATNGHEKCGYLLRDMKLASVRGRCDYVELERAFTDYWGNDFLGVLRTELGESQFNGWHDQIARHKIRTLNPLYRTLLMCFLAGRVSGFVASNPADTPYGHPPFVCENPVCSHYHIDGAEMVLLSYYGNGARAAFECAKCGMRYKVNKSKHSRELRVIVKYGDLWESEFRRCCQDKSISNEQATEIFKCDESTLILQKKKRGLHRRFHYDSNVAPIDFYKAQVETVCAEYDEVTISLLQEKVPGAYDYLKRHDAEWIRSRVVFMNEQKSVREHEDELLLKLSAVLDRLADDGYPKRQVTFGYMASLIGSTRDKLRSCQKLHAFLDGVVESLPTWLCRRTGEICKEKIAAAKLTTVKTVRRELNLSHATYARYQTLLQEVIDSLYDKNENN